MAAVGLGGPPDPRPLPFFDLRPRLGQLVEVRPKLLNFDGVPPPMTFMGTPPPMTVLWAPPPMTVKGGLGSSVEISSLSFSRFRALNLEHFGSDLLPISRFSSEF